MGLFKIPVKDFDFDGHSLHVFGGRE